MGKTDDKLKSKGRIVISILLILLSGYLYTLGNQSAASTIIGAIIGYWAK
jgi:hypothetical protein